MSKPSIVTEIKAILSCGRYLADVVGVEEWGLTKSQALTALEALREKRISVLGGDVYVLTDDGTKSDHANWSCNREPSEKVDDYIDRSIQVAKSYISNYPERLPERLFVLVPHDDLIF